MDWTEFKAEVGGLVVNRRGAKVAPHKAVLLLAVLEMIETEVMTAPFVPLDREVEAAFARNWRRYVPEGSGYRCALHYPFYHLRTSGFWKLWRTPAYVERKEYSLGALKASFYGAIIPETVFELLKIAACREEIRALLRDRYFDGRG